MTGRQLHRRVALALSILMAVLGVLLIVEAIASNLDVLSERLLLGVLFLLAGAGRTYVELRRGGLRR